MKDIQQLIKKNSQEGRYEDIFPKTFIDAVEDRESGNNLNEILSGFNMYFLSYNGSRELTRLQVPMSIRKTGLWITYVLYDKTVVTEWYAGEAIDDGSWKSSDNWRVGSNILVGDISISSDGYWVVNGVVTTTKAQGEQGITPMLRVGSNNRLQVSYTNGSSWVDASTNPVYTQFRINNNKLEQSVDLGATWIVVSDELAYQFRNSGNKLQVSKDLGVTWEDTSDYIAAWFKFTGTTGSSQADNIGKIQISRDNGVTWSDLSGEFTHSLHIKGYVATVGALPSSAVQGDIYGVGPTYDPSDTEQTNPIYQLYVKDSTGWVNNGKFTSIAAGVVQSTGTSTTEVMSQDAVSKEFASVRSDLSNIEIEDVDIVPTTGKYYNTLGVLVDDVNSSYVSIDLDKNKRYTIKTNAVTVARSIVVITGDGTVMQSYQGSNITDDYIYIQSSSAKYILVSWDNRIVEKLHIQTTKIANLDDINFIDDKVNYFTNGLIENYQTVIGVSFFQKITKEIPKGTSFRVRIDGDGLISDNMINLYYNNNIPLDTSNAVSLPFDKIFKKEDDIYQIIISRLSGSIIASGNINFKIDIIDSTSLDNIDRINAVNTQIDEINKNIENVKTNINYTPLSGYYYDGNATLVANADSNYTTAIDVSSFVGQLITIVIPNYNSSSGRYMILKNGSTIVDKLPELNPSRVVGTTGFYVLKNNGASTLLLSYRTKDGVQVYAGTAVIADRVKKVERSLSAAYIATDGSDITGTGDISAPFNTINKCLSLGYTNIICKGGVYEQAVDVTGLSINRLNIIADKGDRVIFKSPLSSVISDGSESLVGGTTKVYSFPYSIELYSGSSSKWLFQENQNDISTLIDISERHPHQRGKMYRLDATRIIYCSATTVEDAIAEIESSIVYKWFYDSDNHLIYISRPASSLENPICKATGTSFFTGLSRVNSIEMKGIEVRYMSVNINNTNNSRLVDVSAKYVYGGGAITWDNSIGVECIRCEACACFSGLTGDGFNAHSTKAYEAFSKMTTARLIDCWSHDNNDDGYSDHERCEISLYGGLYEYNGKAGVTPSYGSHCNCYNVVSQRNYCGFYYTGISSDGGEAGQMNCFGCVSYKNDRGGLLAGYCIDSGNKATLVNCKAIMEDKGYFCTSGCLMTMVDNGAFDCRLNKTGSGTFDVKNTALII